jgi:ABC-2 type transport system permease protein
MVQLSMGAFPSIGVAAVGLMGLPLTLAEYRSRKVLYRLSVTPVHPGTLLFGYKLQAPLLPIVATYLFVVLSIFSIGLLFASTARDVKRGRDSSATARYRSTKRVGWGLAQDVSLGYGVAVLGGR